MRGLADCELQRLHLDRLIVKGHHGSGRNQPVPAFESLLRSSGFRDSCNKGNRRLPVSVLLDPCPGCS